MSFSGQFFSNDVKWKKENFYIENLFREENKGDLRFTDVANTTR